MMSSPARDSVALGRVLLTPPPTAVAMYVLTPHNYTALCLANRFRGWRRTFLGLAGIQVLADLSSCFALGALMAGAILKQPKSSRW